MAPNRHQRRVALVAPVGNIILGTVLYAALLAVCKVIIGSVTVAELDGIQDGKPAQRTEGRIVAALAHGAFFGIAAARPRFDPSAGRPVQHVFLVRGKLLSNAFLFELSLKAACTAAGLVDPAGKPTITAHRSPWSHHCKCG